MSNEKLRILKNTIEQMACDADDKGLADFGLRLSVADAFALSKLEPPRRWIPCSERMPEIGTTVLTLDKRHNIRSRTIRAYMDGELYFTPDGLAPGRHITHWMPLPELPEEVLP